MTACVAAAEQDESSIASRILTSASMTETIKIRSVLLPIVIAGFPSAAAEHALLIVASGGQHGTPLYPRNLPKTCGACHRGQYSLQSTALQPAGRTGRRQQMTGRP